MSSCLCGHFVSVIVSVLVGGFVLGVRSCCPQQLSEVWPQVPYCLFPCPRAGLNCSTALRLSPTVRISENLFFKHRFLRRQVRRRGRSLSCLTRLLCGAHSLERLPPVCKVPMFYPMRCCLGVEQTIFTLGVKAHRTTLTLRPSSHGLRRRCGGFRGPSLRLVWNLFLPSITNGGQFF